MNVANIGSPTAREALDRKKNTRMGQVLIVNSICVFSIVVAFQKSPLRPNTIPALFDLILGILLIRQRSNIPTLRLIALWRAILGTVIGSGLAFAEGLWLNIAAQLLFSIYFIVLVKLPQDKFSKTLLNVTTFVVIAFLVVLALLTIVRYQP